MPSNFSSLIDSGGGAGLLISELGELNPLTYRTLSDFRIENADNDVLFHGVIAPADTTLDPIEELRDKQTVQLVTAIRQDHGIYKGLPDAKPKNVILIDGVVWSIQEIEDESDSFWQLRVVRKSQEKRDKLSEP